MPRARLILAALLLAGAAGAAAWSLAARERDAPARAALRELCASLSASCQQCSLRARGGTPPPTVPRLGTPIPARPLDAWGTPLRVSVEGGGIVLRSAGPDGVHDSADDLVERCPVAAAPTP